MVSGVITPSFNAARAVIGLIVEQGVNAPSVASLWFTKVRIRPLFGSTTATAPFHFPRASMAAARMAGSSPAGLSPKVESPYELMRHGLYTCRRRALTRRVLLWVLVVGRFLRRGDEERMGVLDFRRWDA